MASAKKEVESDPPLEDTSSKDSLEFEDTIDEDALAVIRENSIVLQMLKRLEDFAHMQPIAWKGTVESVAALITFDGDLRTTGRISRGAIIQHQQIVQAIRRALNDLRDAVVKRHGSREAMMFSGKSNEEKADLIDGSICTEIEDAV